MNGFMGKLLRVNLTNSTSSDEPLRQEDAAMFLG